LSKLGVWEFAKSLGAAKIIFFRLALSARWFSIKILL
jgi:hypothetical protein